MERAGRLCERAGKIEREEKAIEGIYLRDIREQVLKEIDVSREVSDEEILDLIDDKILAMAKEIAIGMEEKNSLRKDVFYSLRKLDVLQELVDDNSVTEIMVNGTEHIFIEREGRLFVWNECFSSKEKLGDVIQQIVGKTNRVVNEASPIVDARLENGARVHVVLPPVAINGPILTIRRFPDCPVTMDKLLAWSSITKEAAQFLEKLVKAGYNIFISGGTGSGKTTFLNVLSAYIPKDERVITIEDSAELQIAGIGNLVRLETRNANVEGCQPVSIRDLIKAALRMRPDRLIVGEVRGPEAIDMIQSLNTGHAGLSTGHANSARDMLSRLETMVLMGMEIPLDAIRRQLASGLDILVHLGRLRDKTRRVLEISEIGEIEQGEIRLNQLFVFTERGEDNMGTIQGELKQIGELQGRYKLEAAGIPL